MNGGSEWKGRDVKKLAAEEPTEGEMQKRRRTGISVVNHPMKDRASLDGAKALATDS